MHHNINISNECCMFELTSIPPSAGLEELTSDMARFLRSPIEDLKPR
jgi:hypothetical protein